MGRRQDRLAPHTASLPVDTNRLAHVVGLRRQGYRPYTAQPPPPPHSAAEFGRFCRIGLPNFWVSESRRFGLPNL